LHDAPAGCLGHAGARISAQQNIYAGGNIEIVFSYHVDCPAELIVKVAARNNKLQPAVFIITQPVQRPVQKPVLRS